MDVEKPSSMYELWDTPEKDSLKDFPKKRLISKIVTGHEPYIDKFSYI